jgi:outer membrane protein assembly factor BamE (lipoprotein component of BamABCDE complex)
MTTSFKKASTLAKAFASMSAAAALAGCATTSTINPLSGDELQNTQTCIDFDQAQATAASLKVGTPKAEVYKAFHITGDQMVKRLNKEDVNRALYGQTQLNVPFEKRDEAQSFLNSVEGRSLTCENVHSKRSFSWSHSTTVKDGYQYTVTFIFKDAALFDPVTVQGQPVHSKTNNGYLSNFSPLDTATRAARF